MVKRQILAFKSVAWTSGGVKNLTLPKAPISKITLSRSDDTSDDCTGTMEANCAIEWIKIRINGKVFIDIGGDQDTGKPPMGLNLLREFYKQKHLVALPNEIQVIELPDALPKDAQVDIMIKWATYTQLGCSDASLTYKIDILIEVEDKVPGKVLVPYIMWDKFDHGALINQHIEVVPALPYRLRAIVFLTEDNGTIQSGDYDRLTVSDPNKIYFDGSMAELEMMQEGRSNIALTDGYYILPFPGGIVVAPNTLRMLFDIGGTGGTDLEVHLLFICY